MTQEDKELLLKDLCARLPYNPFIQIDERLESLQEIDIRDFATFINCFDLDMCVIKPYLRPMSSMTEEENRHYLETCSGGNSDHPTVESFDYLKSIHIDYRGLIPLSLALEAPEGMYNIEEK